MSVPGLQPPPPFLPSPGHPAVPWDKWKHTFETYMMTSGASGLPTERRGAILLACLTMEGHRIFSTLKSADLPPGSGALLPLLLLPAFQMLVSPCRRRKRMTLQSPSLLTISSVQPTLSWLDTGSVAVLNVQNGVVVFGRKRAPKKLASAGSGSKPSGRGPELPESNRQNLVCLASGARLRSHRVTAVSCRATGSSFQILQVEPGLPNFLSQQKVPYRDNLEFAQGATSAFLRRRLGVPHRRDHVPKLLVSRTPLSFYCACVVGHT
ncbi:hypothetical protein HPB49_007286 [Dermacentor silvarum]|uniref:Uncharacterized protein n=1 Tax=Dermacentor silvarum TaxID=543639 RepID=A0ACB8C2H8_DERSI|nr:hypothetical protein HPB49_007286 [Dermacentor silvarum]